MVFNFQIISRITIKTIIDIDYSEEKGISIENALGEQAIAGIEKHLSDFLIFYAPTVNSYKRLR